MRQCSSSEASGPPQTRARVTTRPRRQAAAGPPASHSTCRIDALAGQRRSDHLLPRGTVGRRQGARAPVLVHRRAHQSCAPSRLLAHDRHSCARLAPHVAVGARIEGLATTVSAHAIDAPSVARCPPGVRYTPTSRGPRHSHAHTRSGSQHAKRTAWRSTQCRGHSRGLACHARTKCGHSRQRHRWM